MGGGCGGSCLGGEEMKDFGVDMIKYIVYIYEIIKE